MNGEKRENGKNRNRGKRRTGKKRADRNFIIYSRANTAVRRFITFQNQFALWGSDTSI